MCRCKCADAHKRLKLLPQRLVLEINIGAPDTDEFPHLFFVADESCCRIDTTRVQLECPAVMLCGGLDAFPIEVELVSRELRVHCTDDMPQLLGCFGVFCVHTFYLDGFTGGPGDWQHGSQGWYHKYGWIDVIQAHTCEVSPEDSLTEVPSSTPCRRDGHLDFAARHAGCPNCDHRVILHTSELSDGQSQRRQWNRSAC